MHVFTRFTLLENPNGPSYLETQVYRCRYKARYKATSRFGQLSLSLVSKSSQQKSQKRESHVDSRDYGTARRGRAITVAPRPSIEPHGRCGDAGAFAHQHRDEYLCGYRHFCPDPAVQHLPPFQFQARRGRRRVVLVLSRACPPLNTAAWPCIFQASSASQCKTFAGNNNNGPGARCNANAYTCCSQPDTGGKSDVWYCSRQSSVSELVSS